MHRLVDICCLLSILTAFISCNPTSFERPKRQNGNSDYELMQRYWREVLPLGFFINNGAAETGDNTAAVSVRDKIERLESEGSGDVRRDDIARPTPSITIQNDKKATVNNEKISTEESGKLAAKIEKGGDSAGEDKKADPGDKKTVRTTVTCQGQKEWLQCDGPYELIKIKNAFWGRDNDYTCTKSGVTHGLKTDKNCAQDESNTMTKVQEACDNENVCEVVASGIYFDKADCSDVYKFLRMDWECAPSESRIKESVS
ncbi:uncharacterized protein LOC130614355 [Hydractinia symbiolongicarpus]|uniref:uncharacterized protein LOC130614355 n=1 Tax=Hydractinia symbiolongicarpus TaxID=13093 RepID=UPI00254E6852|nr:uncharacterized protein LOC130614355 [Hydractinia symbiolongicarpus]XP_057291763.1 uncharacterized protein LOC130614355 [Hydractinia symbiolongicarpus]